MISSGQIIVLLLIEEDVIRFARKEFSEISFFCQLVHFLSVKCSPPFYECGLCGTHTIASGFGKFMVLSSSKAT